MERNYSPLRYPGGKAKLSKTVKCIIESNKIYDSVYIEPFAGGAGVALSLLFSQYVNEIILNDINYQLFSFWRTLLDNPEYLLRKINDAKLSIDEWKKQRIIFKNPERYEQNKVGFAFFYLNRTNRSGILSAGVIGGYNQSSKYKIDARFNKEGLIKRIELINYYREKIQFYNMDTVDFIQNQKINPQKNYFAYFDPPYFNKGQDLYTNFYTHDDHKKLSQTIQNKILYNWIMTYDDAPEIRELYKDRFITSFNLLYCANEIKIGKELLITSDSIKMF